MTRAQDVMKEINATMKSPVLKMGSDPSLKVTYLPTHILPIDILLQGGITIAASGSGSYQLPGGAVVPGGLVLLHGYAPRQIGYGTGGPPVVENLYTLEALRADFPLSWVFRPFGVAAQGTGAGVPQVLGAYRAQCPQS